MKPTRERGGMRGRIREGESEIGSVRECRKIHKRKKERRGEEKRKREICCCGRRKCNKNVLS